MRELPNYDAWKNSGNPLDAEQEAMLVREQVAAIIDNRFKEAFYRFRQIGEFDMIASVIVSLDDWDGDLADFGEVSRWWDAAIDNDEFYDDDLAEELRDILLTYQDEED